MIRRSKRELERELDGLDDEPPEEPPVPWMQSVPRRLWTDRLAAWRYFISEGEA